MVPRKSRGEVTSRDIKVTQKVGTERWRRKIDEAQGGCRFPGCAGDEAGVREDRTKTDELRKVMRTGKGRME